MEQNSPEWYAARLGMFTASNAYDLICKPKTNPRPYVLSRLAERITGESSENNYVSAEMQWGTDMEPLACKCYARKYGVKIMQVGFIVHPTMRYFGGSPDRLVEDGNKKGIAEVKCPNTTTHIEHCLIDSIDYFKKKYPKKYWQSVANMVNTGSEFFDFISFDPRIDADSGLFVFRLQRIESEVDILLNAVRKSENDLNELAAKVGVSDLVAKWYQNKL